MSESKLERVLDGLFSEIKDVRERLEKIEKLIDPSCVDNDRLHRVLEVLDRQRVIS